MITPIAALQFAPTEAARRNLLSESIPDEIIHVTGNTGIDALRLVSEGETAKTLPPIAHWYAQTVGKRRVILVTGHRRENWGSGLDALCRGIRTTLEKVPDSVVIYTVHLNPEVRTKIHLALGREARVHLLPPQDYASFIWLMRRCFLVLTDSGGIQEEAPSLGKPVLVFRNVTERPEGIEAGTSKLVGTAAESISSALIQLLTDNQEYRLMARAVNPYGDGYAAERIVDRLAAAGPTADSVASKRGYSCACARRGRR